MLTRRRKEALEAAATMSTSHSKRRNRSDESYTSVNTTKKIRKTAVNTKKGDKVTSKLQEKSNPSSEQDANSSLEISDLKNCRNAIEQVVKSRYVDVFERLSLSFPIKCTNSLVECQNKHNRNKDLYLSDNMTASQAFLSNHQPLLYINAISMDVLQDRFPGYSAIQSLFEIILITNESAGGEYNVPDVLQMAAVTIGNIFQKFPPCWSPVNAEYRSLINSNKKNHIKNSQELKDNSTLFDDIISGIERVVQPLAKTTTASAINAMDRFMNDSLNDSLDILSFQQFESKNAPKFSFDDLEREEKIDRLFVSLSLFVQLFESDLAMWTIKNIRKPKTKLMDANKNPLVNLVFFGIKDHIEVNYAIKHILKLYIDYIRIDFPVQYVRTLTRLVNLIYNIFDLSEIEYDSDTIKYPHPIQSQSKFCDSFTKIITETVGCDIDIWLKVIQAVVHPRLKSHLINALLTKIDHKNIVLNPENIYYNLLKMEKDIDDKFDETGHNNNNIMKPKSKKSDIPKERYPRLQKSVRLHACEISQKQHAELLLTALNAYMKVFHIMEFKHYWENYEQVEQQRREDLVKYQAELKNFSKAEPKPFDLSRLKNLTVSDSCGEKGDKGSKIYDLDTLNEESGITECFDIKLNVKKFREDLKFVDMITGGMPNLHSKLGSLFPKQK